VCAGCNFDGGTMKYSDCGWAWVKEQQRPFVYWKEIQRGKHKGMLRLTLDVKVIVPKNAIIQYPKEE